MGSMAADGTGAQSGGKWIWRKNTPPWYGESGGPIIVACQWKRSSPTGPALHCAGGSLPISCNSLVILFNAIFYIYDLSYVQCSQGIIHKEQVAYLCKFDLRL